MRSNIAGWRELHRGGYFDTHPRYRLREMAYSADLSNLTQFGIKLDSDMAVAVIGSGYGREAAIFSPLVKIIYAVDVCPEVFAEMADYLLAKKVSNVMPVLADGWMSGMPSEIDLFYSMATFQHLTKDLVREYLFGIGAKLKPGSGRAVIQFAENETGTADAELKVYEPNVCWTKAEITEAVKKAGLNLIDIKTLRGTNRAGRRWAWHWVLLGLAQLNVGKP